MRLFAFYIVTFLLIFTPPGKAQLLTIRNFSPSSYSSSTQNWGVAEGFGGRMLFGNNKGLLSYDGDEWAISSVANYTSVRSVQMTPDGSKLMAGATDEFGYFYLDGKARPLAYTSLSAQMPGGRRAFGEIWHIKCVGDMTYFQGKNDVFVFRSGRYLVDLKFDESVESLFAVDGRAIVSTVGGLYEVTGGRKRALLGPPVLKGRRVRGIGHYGGQWLLATERDGLLLYDGTACRPFDEKLSQYLRENNVYCAEAHGETMAFGTVKGGLAVINFRTGERHYANVLTGLQNNTVLSMMFDRLGNLWLGLDVGISYVLLSSPYHGLFGLSNNIGTGYASLIEGQRLYLGTNQGLYTLGYPLNITPRPLSATAVGGIVGQIWSLRRIEGTTFCGNNDGAFVVDGMKAARIAGTSGTWNFIALKGHPGYILACDYKGFYLLRRSGGSWAVAWRIAGFGEASGNFYQDADGSIWISHWLKGVYRFRLSADLRRAVGVEYFHRGRGLAVDDNNYVVLVDGRVYVSSVDGFFRYNAQSRRLQRQRWLSDVFRSYGVSLRVYQTPTGALWAYKPGYLAYAQKGRGGRWVSQVMPMHNIIDQLQMSLGHIGFVGTDKTLLNCNDGFYMVRNSLVKDNEESVRRDVQIKRVSSFSSGDSTLYLFSPSTKDEVLKVPRSLNSVRFSFVMPEFRDANAVTYECWLEGQDRSWDVPQTSTFKEYSHLSKGSYVFHVRATDNISRQRAEAAFRIEVLPSWYDSHWAYLCYFLMALFAVRQLVRWQKRRMREAMVKLREGKERQMREQNERFRHEQEEKEHELIKLRAEQLETELKHKSGELADSTINLVRKNDILRVIDENMQQLYDSVGQNEPKAVQKQKISKIRHDIKRNMEDDDNWERFQDNFNIVYDNYLGLLVARFPTLKKNDLKLCAYLKMGLSSKEIASLLNTNLRSVETARYRLRKKLGLEGGENLTGFLQSINPQ